MSQTNNCTIVIADDHPMILKGLFEELTSNGYIVVGQGTNGLEALELILKLKPMLAILDIDMPFLNGFEVVKTAKDKNVETKFIIQSFHKEADYVMQAKSMQLKGYLLKEDSFIEIEKCIKAVLNNESYFSTSFESGFLQNMSKELQQLKLLTPSEITILKQIAQQITTSAIADGLGISVRTIEKHRSNIINKLNLKNESNSLTSWAILNRNTIITL
ncbi:response regulator [Lutibacter flavus]|uniref:Two component transcriptional regulator, LuxR family n=1 Tax=Lutibacter flavus TaxID=691689 RepID=A0A238YLV0_9FLAO|nr:response regulator transcription factor [Lutibacter flavus]SNR71614.1 two component transcriptional regulator, LuxR family [Lutibacter flavus]